MVQKDSYILGLSAFYHDSAACLLKNGEIIAAAQEERFTRKKHDADFPALAIDFCLKHAGIKASDIEVVAFYDKPFLKFERLLETYLHYAPKGLTSFIKAMPVWIKQKIWIKETIKEKLGFEGKIIFPEHHISHAASAFFPSPFKKASIITMDGVGEWTTTSFGSGIDNRVIIDSEIKFPHSLGLLYSAFTYYTGFKVNSGEYKVMGLAPYGEPKYKNLILDKIISVKDDGSFHLNMEYFKYPYGLKMTSHKFHDLFGGKPRKPESKLTQKEMDLARSVQEVTEEIVLKTAAHTVKNTGLRDLCLAGGVALNCVANGKLLRSNIIDNLWIQPAAGDAGGAVGSALAAWHMYLHKPRSYSGQHDNQSGSYLGKEYSENDILDFLKTNHIPYKKSNNIFSESADLIKSENVIGWFQGRMEFGPRALGNRSIVGDARSEKMQRTMNLKIKYRESFRPFAPAVLEEEASNWFDLDTPSPYMLLVADVKSEHLIENNNPNETGIERINQKRSTIPAITHVDNSARIQTVNKNTNPRFHKLLSEFFNKTGCPVVVNTSFNVRGEPIVESPEDAYKCFMRTEMDYLVLGDYLLDKKDQPEFLDTIDWKQTYELD